MLDRKAVREFLDEELKETEVPDLMVSLKKHL